MRTLAISGLAGYVLAFACGSAAAETCEWANRRVLTPDVYSFAVSSWVRQEASGHRYYTCVENLQDRVLWFDWFIPGPKSYIPAKQMLPSPRYFTTRETRDIRGCLEYGNHHAPLKEYFVGHEKDVSQEQVEGNCDRQLSVDTPKAKNSNWLEPIRSVLELFVATNADDVEKTLLRVTINAEAFSSRKRERIRFKRFK
jgi:hypothetical protein